MVTAKRVWVLVGLIVVVLLWGCSTELSEDLSISPTDNDNAILADTPVKPADQDDPAPTSSPASPTDGVDIDPTITPMVETAAISTQPDILAVNVNKNQDAYNFSVTISSPDQGCSQYADWWEVVTEDGELLYRRILLHSHVNEQPFTRSGGPVSIAADTIVLVRAHMHPTGYGGLVMKGSVAGGFEQVELGADFASELAETAPLPEGCNF